MKYLYLLCYLFCGHALASQWPDIEFPTSAKVEIVADNMLSHGYPMRAWVVIDTQQQMQMAQFFIDQWQDKSEKFDARLFNGDYVINSLQPPFLLTARIHREFDKSITYIGITENVDEASLKKAANKLVPKPSGTDVISDIQSNDLYKQGRTLVMTNNKSLASSYHFYRRHYQQRGWVENSAIIDTSAGKAVLQMSQGTSLVDISFSKNNSKVYIVAQHTQEAM
jgi:hypothetical protein